MYKYPIYIWSGKLAPSEYTSLLPEGTDAVFVCLVPKNGDVDAYSDLVEAFCYEKLRWTEFDHTEGTIAFFHKQ